MIRHPLPVSRRRPSASVPAYGPVVITFTVPFSVKVTTYGLFCLSESDSHPPVEILTASELDAPLE